MNIVLVLIMILSELISWWGNNTQADTLTYKCTSCGARFELQRQACPECSGYSIERCSWEDIPD